MSGLPVPVFAISMRPEFWERLLKQVVDIGVRPTLFEATDGRQIDLQQWIAEGRYDPPPAGENPRTRGELGCSDSHIRVWSHIVEQDLPGGLVLEDDASVPQDLAAWVNEAWEHRAAWDICYLGHSGWAYTQPVEGVANFNIPNIADGWHVMHGYLLTQQGARILLQGARPIRLPVDVFVSRRTRHELRVWQSARPVIGVCEGTYSSTQGIQ